jgi:hypothetical protein
LRPIRLPDNEISAFAVAVSPTRPVPDREVRRLIVADTITEIHQRSRGTYGRRRVRAALLADYETNVNHKLVNKIMAEYGLYGLPRPGRRKPNLSGLDTPADLVNRRFTATPAK